MTVEQGWKAMGENEKQFPVGMRVLVVDDDHTCLRVLERLLRQCEYHVTTTTHAISALEMLRENRNKFDLVISDVHMPDMDGFKLLEYVEFEMDLPVIMMSGNGDTKNVMKGVTHGACDYLLKPVRIEELRNIWQHVIRRKKADPKGPNNSEKPRGGTGTSEGVQGPSPHNADHNRKRKDQDEDEFEDDDGDENGQENEDPSAQKRPRVVWSVELHRKFVAAVNQLGIEKAFPKKILDLMNVEKLTRENVASHLQKYRLYLKRISSVASQQANMVAALGGKDSTYLGMASLDGMGDFHTLTGLGHLSNSAFPSFTPSGMLGRLNTPAGLGLRGLASSGMIQLGHPTNSNSSFNDLGKLQSSVLPGSQHGNLLNGIPTSLELNHLQPNKFISRSGEFSPINDQTMFPLSSTGFSDAGLRIGNTNSFMNTSNNQLLLKGNIQQVQNQGGSVNQSSISLSSNSSEPFEIGNGVSTQLPDNGRCSDNWQGAVTLTGFVATTLPLSGPFSYADLPPGNIRNTVASFPSNIRNNSIDSSSNNFVSLPFHDSGRDPQLQGASVCIKSQLDNLRPSTFGSIINGVNPNMKYTMQQNKEDTRRDYIRNSTVVYNSMNSSLPVHGTLGSFGQNFGKENVISNKKKDSPLLSQINSNDPFLMQHNGFDNSSLESGLMLKGVYQMDQTKTHSGFMDNSSGSLEDLMNAMIKREESQDFMFMDGDNGCNNHYVRTCM